MARSNTYYEKTNAVSASESPLYLIEITHPQLSEPVRIVNNTEDIVHLGNTFYACAFDLSLPSQDTQQAPSINMRIDNVGRILTDPIEQTKGGKDTEWRIMQILPSDPDTIEWETTIQSKNVTMDQLNVSVGLGFQQLIDLEGMNTLYTPTTAPGLFP